MKVHEFTIVASGLDHDSDDFEDRFFMAGCDDSTISAARGAIILHFARGADSLGEAIQSAIDDVTKAGARVERVEPDHLVSLSEIAERAHLTRAAISLYAKGERGRDFPHPVARVTSESPLWDWTDVARWLHGRRRIAEDIVRDAEVIRSANEHLSRAHRPDRALRGTVGQTQS
jgi:hypothetical protein